MMQLELKAPLTLYLIILLFFFGSCVSHQELITLNGGDPQIDRGLNRSVHKSSLLTPTNFKIQPADLLVININAFEGNTTQFLQQEFASRNLNNGSREYGPDALYYNSYEVDANGYITLPLIDTLKVSGLTTNQLKSRLDEAYKPYLKMASTSVKLANLRVTILGEVESPGVQYFFSNQTTILEAISLAGDFTDFGNRQKVKLIRREGKSTKTIILDLNKPDFLGTEYYFIHPNDLIYIEPIKAKAFDVGAQSVGIVLSVISTAALLANILFDLKNK
ncbi:MAG: polysaccharide biosynthesis/export family protein [Saprospiraceae bacterium]|nr:polysaccharide biosynthesis/export family protein [Saprospiraceae bacterium]